ncbi:MAG: hypothetical protein ACRD4R_00870 [Candidatus Acidiferrales bacterium]
MPFINGRYYVNPIMGEALEAAREAEAALATLENRARQNSGADQGNASGDANNSAGDGFGDESGAHGAPDSDGPIHRVEIEAAELVPAQSGRAASGYVARVQRRPAAGAESTRSQAGGPGGRAASNDGATGALVGGQRSGNAAGRAAGHTETHVFADHRDLLSFLRDELAKDSHSRHSS